MRQAWNSRQAQDGLLIMGTVQQIRDENDELTFTVSTDGVLRTVTMAKAGAQVRITGPGTITITEAQPNA